MNKYYYYISGNMGMTPSGSFTKDSSRWIKFDEIEKNRIESLNGTPYGSTKKGIFVKIQ